MLSHHYIELFAALSALFLFQPKWGGHYKLIIVLLVTTFCVEYCGYLMSREFKVNNNWLYNIFLPFQCFCFLYFFYRESFSRDSARAHLVLLWLIPTVLIISYAIHRDIIFLNSYAANLFLILMLLASGIYFIDAVMHSRIKMVAHPPFWIASGLLFFTVSYILIFSLWSIITTILHYKLILAYTNIIANLLLYGGIIASLICLRKTSRSSMPS